MHELMARLWDWIRRDRLDAELAEELEFHRAQLERDRRAQGSEREDAYFAARRQLGNVTVIHEQSRERWSWPWLDHLQQDLRSALRGLRRSPGFALSVVVTLGLGIGANVAIFNVVDQLMFRPIAYMRDSGSVHRVYLRVPGAQRFLQREAFPYARYLDLKAWTTSFSQYAAFYPTKAAVGRGGGTRERQIAAVSASFFEFFNAQPVRGRFFGASEDTTPVGAAVVVLGNAFWKSEFGGREVLGETLQVENVLCTIIGVAPDGFAGVADAAPPAVFIPITTFGGHEPGESSAAYWERYTWDWAEMMVRLTPGVTEARANADLTSAYRRSREQARVVHAWLSRKDPSPPIAMLGALKTAAGPYAGREARTMLWITGVAIIVLVIACANVANLFLARAMRRRREVALRLALGVSRWRLAAQALTDGWLLSMLGCGAGIAMARGGGVLLKRLALPDAVDTGNIADWRTLSVALVAALVAGTITSLAPIVLASREDVGMALKSGAREGTYQRSCLRSSLLVMQGALSVVLLIGAGLFVRSLERLQAMPLGYRPEPVLLVQWNRRGEQMNDSARMAVRRRLLDVAQTVPGVEHAAWVSNVPVQGTSTMGLAVPGIDSLGHLGRFTYQSASDDYFATVGTRIVRGRAFTSADRANTPLVTVVSAAMAHALWPGEESLGRCLKVGGERAPCTTVVGVAEDAVHDPVNDQPLRYYLPMEQVPSEGGSILVLRMRGEPSAMAEGVRRALQAAMPGDQFVTVTPMTRLLDEQRRGWRVGATMFATFGLLALLVAAVGLYGVIAYTVSQRLHEVGVRMALGARAGDVVRLVMSEGVRLVALGVTLGVACALIGARWIQPLLFEQSATDPAIYAAVGGVLLVVSLVASAVPAARATRADPSVVLRSE